MRNKVFKATDAARKQVTAFSTDELRPVGGDADSGAEASDGEPVEEVDPEALRAAILAEAREEARQKVDEAYERGLALGREAGEAQFRASVGEAVQTLETAAHAMQSAREAFLSSLESQVVELATLIAARVLDREVRADPNLVNSTVRRALGVLVDRQHLRLQVNPADLDALNAHKLSLLHDFSGIESIEVVGDATVGPGGCVVVSETMEVDARLETLLSEVLDNLSD